MGEDQASAPSEKQQLEVRPARCVASLHVNVQLTKSQDKMLSALSTVLHSMSEVKVKMQAYSNYFETQQETDHALYEWPAYDKHQELKAAIQTLENANNDLNSVHREPTDVSHFALDECSADQLMRKLEGPCSIKCRATFQASHEDFDRDQQCCRIRFCGHESQG